MRQYTGENENYEGNIDCINIEREEEVARGGFCEMERFSPRDDKCNVAKEQKDFPNYALRCSFPPTK